MIDEAYIANNREWNGKDISMNETFVCDICEKESTPITFFKVNKAMRIKIYKMSEEERMNWIKGFRIAEKLRKENEDEDEIR